MIFAGIDIGSRAAKAVLLEDSQIISTFTGDTGAESVKASHMAASGLLKETGITLDNIDYIMATGYGRVLVPFANENVSEISAHARGINYFYPGIRTILDMGGQDCKAIRCDEKGNVTNFVMNDKCAGGTGRFLEMIADTLGLKLEEIGDVSLQSLNAIPFNTICAVFAKTEALNHLRHGVARSDILCGLNEAISSRCLNLLKKVGIEEEFTITGGIAKNKGHVAKITQKTGLDPRLAQDPQIIGALGAALYAREKYLGRHNEARPRIQYGYTDATGDYFITVDLAKCDGCGDCVNICPANIFELANHNGCQPAVRVSDSARKQIATLCPGGRICMQKQGKNCLSACPHDALGISW
jgi:predicted CoA-substrate-specific enzyme activase